MPTVYFTDLHAVIVLMLVHGLQSVGKLNQELCPPGTLPLSEVHLWSLQPQYVTVHAAPCDCVVTKRIPLDFDWAGVVKTCSTPGLQGLDRASHALDSSGQTAQSLHVMHYLSWRSQQRAMVSAVKWQNWRPVAPTQHA